MALWLAHFHPSELVSVPYKIILSPNWFKWLTCLTHLDFWHTGYFTLSQYWWWVFYMYVVQKVRFPIFYLNKIVTYRATHDINIHSHISFTSPHKSPSLFRHLLQWYINLSSPSYKKGGAQHVTISCLHFEHLHWSGITDLWVLFIFGNRWKSNGARSWLYGGCGTSSQPQEFKRFTVVAALWGRALSCKRPPVVNYPGVFLRIASLSLFKVSW